MKKASITKTKNQLSSLLDAVKHGETVLIMDRDRPVARLEPVGTNEGDQREGRIAELERAGILQRPAKGARQALERVLRQRAPSLRKGASAVQAIMDERAKGR